MQLDEKKPRSTFLNALLRIEINKWLLAATLACSCLNDIKTIQFYDTTD